MEVNVITRHAPANYGSLLQSIATQKVLEKVGVENKIIDYIPKEETGVRIAFTQLKGKKSWNCNPLKKMAYILGRELENLIMYHKFERMRKKYLNMTEHFSTEQELVGFAAESNSIFMTGSDQVWGPVSTGVYDPVYFLEFVSEEKKKIAFASSFGKASFSETDIRKYKKMLSRYSNIAVRENSAVEMLYDMGIEARQVLDPTLLVTSEKWEEYISDKDIPKEEYVLVYQIHNNPELDRYAIKFAEKVGLPLRRVSPLLHQVRRGGKFIYLPDIGQFLALIKNANYMVTDSFHGTAFAVNFNTQFVEVLPNTGTASRNQSILKLLGLENRIVKDNNDFCFISQMIDYTIVNQRLIEERNRTMSVLKQILEF